MQVYVFTNRHLSPIWSKTRKNYEMQLAVGKPKGIIVVLYEEYNKG